MPTKKQLPKKAAKAAKTAKKSPLKKGVDAKHATKHVAKKAVLKKSASTPVKVAKKASSVAKHASQVKHAPSKYATVAKKAAPAPLKKPVPVKPAPVKHAEPVKKPSVGAPTTHEVKPSIKPLEKHAVKQEPPKPTKLVIPKTSTTKAVKYEPDFTKSVLDSPQHEQPGPTMRYSDTELIEFRDLIMKKLETAKKELAYLQGLITRKDEGGDMEDGRYMTMEDGSMSMEREQLSQMASRQIQFIDHLEKALMRIENKTYGICRVTGKLIDKARLRAVPHATLSIEAKQLMNK